MKAEKVIDDIVKATSGAAVEYKKISYNGVPLLITRQRLKPLVEVTWERTHSPEVERLALEFGMELRKGRCISQ